MSAKRYRLTILNEKRLSRLRSQMAERAVDVVVLSPSANWLYLVPFAPDALERPTLLMVSHTAVVALVADFDSHEMKEKSGVDLIFGWKDEDGPEPAARRAWGHLGVETPRRVALDDFLPFLFFKVVEPLVTGAETAAVSEVLATLRMVKDESEIAAIRSAAGLLESVVQTQLQELRPGMTEREIALRLEHVFRDAAAVTPPMFSVQFGAHTAMPHYRADDTELETDQPVLLDIYIAKDLYNADITRQAYVGPVPAEYRDVFGIVQEAQAAGLAKAGPGVPAQEVDRACRSVIAAAGFGDRFSTRTGHGIGMEIHEPPSLVEGNEMPLEEGMVVTIEPGIYIPDRFGVRIEDTVLITKDGCERLTQLDRELTVIA